MRIGLVVGFGLMTTLLVPAAAQRIPGGRPPTSEECSLAIQSIAEGQRPETWHQLADCGSRGVLALVRGLSDLAAGSFPESAAYLLGALSGVRAEAISEAAVRVIQDRHASLSGRVVALFAGLSQHHPAVQPNLRMPFDRILAGELVPRCPFAFGVADAHLRVAEELSLAHLNAFRDAVRAASADESAPDGLRQLAGCAYSIAGPIPTPPDLIRLEYVCGNRFRVINQGAESVRLRYEVTTGGLSGGLVVRANSSFDWTVTSRGVVTLYHEGVAISTQANGGVPCPPEGRGG